MVDDIDDPHEVEFVAYVNPDPTIDKAPEGIVFIDDDDSPTRSPLVVVANEVSGTTAIYEIDK